jgi:hypothetical protein
MRTLRDATLADAAMLCDAEKEVVRLHDGPLVSALDELDAQPIVERIQMLASGKGKFLIAESDGRAVGHA